jgi:hypothetical protein
MDATSNRGEDGDTASGRTALWDFPMAVDLED